MGGIWSAELQNLHALLGRCAGMAMREFRLQPGDRFYLEDGRRVFWAGQRSDLCLGSKGCANIFTEWPVESPNDTHLKIEDGNFAILYHQLGRNPRINAEVLTIARVENAEDCRKVFFHRTYICTTFGGQINFALAMAV